MPLNTSVTREGSPVPLRWGWWHVTVLAEQSALDEGVPFDPSRLFDAPIFRNGTHVVTTARTWEDAADGEVLTLLPGDVLFAARGF